MLYDVFICHASEDKDSFVRPLADSLRKENVEVWYDEFTLRLGDSIRRSLDKGLKQSRFGVVILSKAFFEKKWPQYELDGLAEREMKGADKILLPVWHGVTHEDVIQYSPSLAGRKAVSSKGGMRGVVDAILDVVHPHESPLIVARDLLIEYGLTPPVITDQYWLEVTEASNRVPGFGAAIPAEASWDRWSFPLPSRDEVAGKWGERLAWTAMQLDWVKTADAIPISPLTEPSEVLSFIESHAGLLEVCETYPALTAEYAPQITIPGMGGCLESLFEEEYQRSIDEHLARRATNPGWGSALTTGGDSPLCDAEWALRHPSLGNYDSSQIAESYFDAGMFGPRVSPFHGIDHAAWLLSRASTWLPKHIRDYLITGTKDLINWQWGRLAAGLDRGGNWSSNGALLDEIYKCSKKRAKFRWTKKAQDDARNRLEVCVKLLKLPESVDELFDLFAQHEFPQHSLAIERDLRDKQAGRNKKKSSATNGYN